MPLLQAIIDEEREENYTELFEALCAMWSRLRPHDPPLQTIVKQVHKDFCPGLEAARRAVFPASRPCDDFFHLAQKRVEISVRCSEVVMQSGKRVKANLDWIMACLEALHRTPTADILSKLWPAFMERLRHVGEDVVATYLDGTYSREATVRQLQQMGIETVSSNLDSIFTFCSFWAGAAGVYPGTGGGNQATEAIHSQWQAELESLGGRGSIVEALRTMQNLYPRDIIPKSRNKSGANISVTVPPGLRATSSRIYLNDRILVASSLSLVARRLRIASVLESRCFVLAASVGIPLVPHLGWQLPLGLRRAAPLRTYSRQGRPWPAQRQGPLPSNEKHGCKLPCRRCCGNLAYSLQGCYLQSS